MFGDIKQKNEVSKMDENRRARLLATLGKTLNLRKTMVKWILAGGVFFLGMNVSMAWASPFHAEQLVPVSDRVLDHMRGGFSSGPLNVTFGIQSLSMVNGQLIEQLNLNGSSGNSGTHFASSTFQITPLSGNSLGTLVQVYGSQISNGVSNALTQTKGIVNVIQNTQSNVSMKFQTSLSMTFNNVASMVQTVGMNNRLLSLH